MKMMMTTKNTFWAVCQLLLCTGFAAAFTPLSCVPPSSGELSRSIHPIALEPFPSLVSLSASGGGKKRKRRRRKVEDNTVSDQQVKQPPSPSSPESVQEVSQIDEDDISLIRDVAKFQFEQDGIVDSPEGEVTQSASEQIPLPDIKETLKKKEEEEKARILEEKLKEKRRIKRSDKEAFTRLLEQQPYADADDSYFFAEDYNTVSALLGEGSKPFLGIPTGPLQVGHFIGSLGIILMAFVEYPGFPLTNLPTPLREFLQGGLGVTYAINLVLAVSAVFKASERGQSALLWVAKTLSVGGLAYDQLTQLPLVDKTRKKSKK